MAPWELLRQHPKWFFQALQADRAEIAGAEPATVHTVGEDDDA